MRSFKIKTLLQAKPSSLMLEKASACINKTEAPLPTRAPRTQEGGYTVSTVDALCIH